MKPLKRFCFFILILIPCILYSQEKTNETLQFINLYCNIEKPKKDRNTGFSPLNFYSRFISSQDHSECPFYPSCSVYMKESVKKYNFFIGFLKGLDRLSRCNRFQEDYFELSDKHKMIDLP